MAKFRPQQNQRVLTPQLSERLKRTIHAHNDISQQYEMDRKSDKAEIECSLYKQRYPNNVKKQLLTLIRVRLPENVPCFELDDIGTIDEQHTVKEALCYSIAEWVFEPSNPDANSISYCTTKIGMYRRPFGIFDRDDLNNIVGGRIVSFRNMFYIEFTPDNVQKVLDEFGHKYKSTALAIADSGTEQWTGMHVYSVPNLTEWRLSDFDELLESNRAGTLTKYEGGVEEYLKRRAQKEVEVQKTIEEIRNRKKKLSSKQSGTTKNDQQ